MRLERSSTSGVRVGALTMRVAVERLVLDEQDIIGAVGDPVLVIESSDFGHLTRGWPEEVLVGWNAGRSPEYFKRGPARRDREGEIVAVVYRSQTRELHILND